MARASVVPDVIWGETLRKKAKSRVLASLLRDLSLISAGGFESGWPR